MATAPFRRYTLKQQFRTLFSNLVTGATLTPRDALRDQLKPTRKGYSEEEIKNRIHDQERALMEALVDAGFLDVVEEQVEYIEPGEE